MPFEAFTFEKKQNYFAYQCYFHNIAGSASNNCTMKRLAEAFTYNYYMLLPNRFLHDIQENVNSDC